jgi:hypothetical protein
MAKATKTHENHHAPPRINLDETEHDKIMTLRE